MVQRALSFHTDAHTAVEDVGLLIILINMKKTNYEIKLCSDSFVLIKDIGPWDRYMTVTNAAEDIVEELNCFLNGRRLFYVDSSNYIDEILIEHNKFAGFKLLNNKDIILAMD